MKKEERSVTATAGNGFWRRQNAAAGGKTTAFYASASRYKSEICHFTKDPGSGAREEFVAEAAVK